MKAKTYTSLITAKIQVNITIATITNTLMQQKIHDTKGQTLPPIPTPPHPPKQGKNKNKQKKIKKLSGEH